MNDPHAFAAATLNAILEAKIKPDALGTLPTAGEVERLIAPLHAALLAMYQGKMTPHSTSKTPDA